MNFDVVAWFAQWIALDSLALPSAQWMGVWRSLGWGVVLGWLAGFGCSRVVWRYCGVLSDARARGIGRYVPVSLAAVTLLWCGMPGPYSPTYWLGLAFQAPAISTVLLCTLGWAALVVGPSEQRQERQTGLAAMGVGLGVVLLVDTLALLPVSLYAWGFSPVATGLVLLLTLLPWVLKGGASPGGWGRWVAPCAVAGFALLRLPSGNLWDALLDPWLWLALSAYLGRSIWCRYRPHPSAAFL